MSSNNHQFKIKCWYCNKYYKAGRSLSTHLRSCGNKLVYQEQYLRCSSIDVANPTSTTLAPPVLDPRATAAKNNEENININEQNEQNEDEEKVFNDQFDAIPEKEGSVDTISDEQLTFINKQIHYQRDTKNVEAFTTDEILCQVDLLKKLKDLDCPMYAYDHIIDWAMKWSSKHKEVRNMDERKKKSVFDESNGSIRKRRKTVLSNLAKKLALKGLVAETRTIEMKSIDSRNGLCSLNVAVFDFKEQLFCLLRNTELMKPSNLVFDGDKPGVPPNFQRRYVSELNHGSWYENAYKYYENKFGADPNRIICGIILSIDKTFTDQKGKLCLEPVKFSLTLFNTETRRKNESAWRRLGYINDMDTEEVHKMVNMSSEDFVFNFDIGKEKPTPYSKRDKKSTVYHRILSEILKDLKTVQNIGMLWKLKYPDGKYYDVKLYFPISMCVVDMKGGKQLCGMYDSYSNISRPCISCNIHSKELSIATNICEPVLANELVDIIKSGDADKLQSVSQARNHHNVFFQLELCEWKFGIWGLCPSEVLHQYYEGIVDYVLKEFYEEVLTETYRDNLVRWCYKIVNYRRQQSDKDFPTGNFVMGITKSGKIKGTEKFASLFYLSLFLHTSVSRTKLFAGKRENDTEMIKTLKTWRHLFEDMLYYHDWLLQKRFDRNDMDLYAKKILSLFKSIKKLVIRKGLGIAVPKFHEFHHIVRDIERFGPPRGYDTCGNEGFLHRDKIQSRHTQRRIKSFTSQTSIRHYESDVIDLSFKTLNKNMKSPKLAPTTKQKHDVCLRGPFVTQMDKKDGKIFILTFVDEKYGRTVKNDVDFSPELKVFLKQHVFSLLQYQGVEEYLRLNCYTTIYRKGICFRGASRDRSEEVCGWAMVQWAAESDNELFLCPAQIVMYVSFEKVTFRDQYSALYPEELYVIIRSLEETPMKTTCLKHIPICEKCSFLDGKSSYHIVSIDTLFDVSFVIPDIPHDNEKKEFLYVFPRYHVMDYNDGEENNDNNEFEGNGWSNRFTA